MKLNSPRRWLYGFLCSWMFACPIVDAQPFSVVHSFGYVAPGAITNDGKFPAAGLISDGNTLYGTATSGGATGFYADNGTIFKGNTDGGGFTNLHVFLGEDGSHPQAPLILSSNVLYGTTRLGGKFSSEGGDGTVFRLNTDGSGFTNLHSFTPMSNLFTNLDGSLPGTLVLSGGMLYGTTESGGRGGQGAIFKLDTNGNGFTVIHDFTPIHFNPSGGSDTNIDGATPESLVLSGSTLYGVAQFGGSHGNGTLFKLNTDGLGFTVLHNFSGVACSGLAGCLNGDGEQPNSLCISGDTLYGTASGAGTGGSGTIFKMDTNGNFTTLHSFSFRGVAPPAGLGYTNYDGVFPTGLAVSNDLVYGTAQSGGAGGEGTLFKIDTNGMGFSTLHNFTGASDGGTPVSGVMLSNGSAYGLAGNGGDFSGGTLFALNLSSVTSIPLNFQQSGNALIFNWSDPAFSLQSTPSLTTAFTNMPNATSPYTNLLNGPQGYFRLVH